MATDFTYNNKTIAASGPFKPTSKNTPIDARTRANTYSDIAGTPNPHIGMKITVLSDETNSGKMTDYIVKTLKANEFGQANSLVDEVQRYVDYLGASTSGSGSDPVTTGVILTSPNGTQFEIVVSDDGVLSTKLLGDTPIVTSEAIVGTAIVGTAIVA